MAALLFFKAMVAGHIRADGTIVRTYHRRDRASLNARYGRVMAAARRAYEGAPLDVRQAVDGWHHANWHLNPLQAAYRGEPARAELRAQVDAAFAPVRAALIREFGPTVPLYRGEQHFAPGSEEPRGLYSWTLDPRVARDFALKGRPYRVPSKAELARIVDAFEARGYAQHGRRQYLRDRENPGYYLIFDQRQPVTDGDDLADDLARDRADMEERNREILSRGHVFAENIPIAEIAWVEHRPEQREFLVTRGPSARARPVS